MPTVRCGASQNSPGTLKKIIFSRMLQLFPVKTRSIFFIVCTFFSQKIYPFRETPFSTTLVGTCTNKFLNNKTLKLKFEHAIEECPQKFTYHQQCLGTKEQFYN